MKKIRKIDAIRRTKIGQKRWKKKNDLKKRRKGTLMMSNNIEIPMRTRITLASEFNFSKNYDETVKSLIRLKQILLKSNQDSDDEQNFYIDMTTVKSITVAGALVLAAEMDRWRKLASTPLEPVSLKKWDKSVRSLLYSLGFFELLDVDPEKLTKIKKQKENIVILKLRSYEKFIAEYIGKEVLDVIQNIKENLSSEKKFKIMSVYVALFEALDNSLKHAYPYEKKEEYEFEPISRCWCTACWNQESSEFQFLVYDQGIGIPASLPRSNTYEKIRDKLRAIYKLGAEFNLGTTFIDKSAIIQAAIEVSRTSKGRGHGKGLREIVEPVNRFEGSKVRILSGEGSFTLFHNEKVEKIDHKDHIGGTLIEWTIPIK